MMILGSSTYLFVKLVDEGARIALFVGIAAIFIEYGTVYEYGAILGVLCWAKSGGFTNR